MRRCRRGSRAARPGTARTAGIPTRTGTAPTSDPADGPDGPRTETASDLVGPEAHERLVELLAAVEDADHVVVLTHDNPDPDALASAAALAHLLRERGGLSVRIAFGGIVGRAENRELIRAMDIELERAEDVEISTRAAIAMVDTQPRAGNNALPPGRIVSIVIDHHPERPDTTAAGFTDIRTDYGASAAIMLEYLLAAELEPPAWLATALFYAIQTETMDLGREASAADIAASAYLYARSDPAAISRIRHAPVPASYFRSLHEALDVARRYGRVVAVPMGRLPYPDIVAEFADLFLQMNGVDWTMASGRYRDRLLVSIRTYDTSAHAGARIREAIGDRGSAGGHGTLAGGQVDLRKVPEDERDALVDDIHRDLLTALGADLEDEQPLVGGERPGVQS